MNKLNAQGTRSEEESVPRQGWRGPSVPGMAVFATFRSDRVPFAGSVLPLPSWTLSTISNAANAAFFVFDVSGCTGSGSIRLSQRRKSAIHGGSARSITHLIPEVRPYTGQRFALFKNAPGVFVPGPRCFATGVYSHRFEFMSCLKKRAALALFCALSYNAYKGCVSEDF